MTLKAKDELTGLINCDPGQAMQAMEAEVAALQHALDLANKSASFKEFKRELKTLVRRRIQLRSEVEVLPLKTLQI